MIGAERGLWPRLVAWSRHQLPTRESIEGNRLLRPVAHRVLAPALWRFTRRSVPRGVALGMVTGILFPVAQIPFSALLALPFRANIPVAVAMTFITNPFTTPFIWVAAYWIGRRVLHLDAGIPGAPIAGAIHANAGWLHWLWSEAGPATLAGLVVITLVLSIGGFFVSALGWRWRVARKWRTRHRKTVAP